ncbi:MAG: ATP-binding cassette domain-containing protein [Mycobacterium sp.]|nr:ATP-binding cassette domain-containing protein [Mycobacterium sp.]
MRPEGSAFPALPLTVWIGSTRYVFVPGRDVIVGYGSGCDIALERLGNAGGPPPPPRRDVVLRFAGGQWTAIDRSPYGMFFNGARVRTVNIRDGQAITLGDPRRGPRLVFQVGAPGRPSGRPRSSARPQPPAAARPGPPSPAPGTAPADRPPQADTPAPPAPTQWATQRMRIGATGPAVERRVAPAKPERACAQEFPPPPTAQPTTQLPAPTAWGPADRPAQPADQRPRPTDQPARGPDTDGAPPKGRGVIKRVSDASRKLRAQRASFRSEEADPTYRLPLQPGARTTGVAAFRVGIVVDGREALADVSFKARPGTLTAVVGPSAGRNSALLDLLAGTRQPGSGVVTVDGHDVHAEPESMRTRIGIVPRHDRVHPHLTVEQALGYAAELRLPPDTTSGQRARVVNQVLEETGLTSQRTTAIRKLSPEGRRCVSMAVELVSRPTLLVVDGLSARSEAAREDHLIAVLRRQADLGCAVVVAMTSQASLNHLTMCDQAVILTAAGTPAFVGAPPQVESAMGTADWSKIFVQVSADPDAAHLAFRDRQLKSGGITRPDVAAPWAIPHQLSWMQQTKMVCRRQLRLLVNDHGYGVFLAVLPLVLAALTLLTPGDSGLGRPDLASPNLHEAVEILAALNFGAVLIGIALTIRDLVNERQIYRREQSVGLQTSAYLTGKLVAFAIAAAALTAALTTLVVAGKGGPVHGAVLLGNADIELYVSLAATAIASAIVGLALSARSRSMREALPLAVPVVLASLLFAGGLLPLVGTWGYDQISWLVPAQWGFAASASTVDLRRVDNLAANVEMWTHYVGWWLFDINMLALLGALWVGLAWYWLRPPQPPVHDRSPRREQQEVAASAG